MQPKIILASQSPRRRELFKLVVKSHGIQDFSIQAAEIDEKRIEAEILANSDGAFQDTVKKLAGELAAVLGARLLPLDEIDLAAAAA